MKINLRIVFTDDRIKEVTCGASDLVKFEEKFDISIAKLESETRITHLLYLAWSSEVRTKATAATFESWVETVESVGLGSESPK